MVLTADKGKVRNVNFLWRIPYMYVLVTSAYIFSNVQVDHKYTLSHS